MWHSIPVRRPLASATRLFFLLLLLILFIAPVSRADEEFPPLFPIERTLANGLRVVIEEDHRLPIAGMRILYGVGSSDDPDGLSYLVPRLMHRATKHVRRGEYQRLLDAAGCRGSTWSVGIDRTFFAVSVPSSRIALPLWLWSDQMAYFDEAAEPAAVDEARQQAQNNRTSRVETRPFGALENLVRKELYPDKHPYRDAVIGAPPTIVNATAEDVRKFHAAAYGPENAVLVIVGDVKLVPTLALVERYFGAIRRGAGFSAPTAAPRPLPHNVQLVVAAGVDHGLLSFDWPLPASREPDVHLQVLAEVLRGKDVRELEWKLDVRGVHTRATASYSFRERGSTLRLTVEVPRGTGSQEVIDAVDASLEELARGIPESSVKSAVAAIARWRANGLEQVENRAERLAGFLARTGRASRAYDEPREPTRPELTALVAALRKLPRVVTVFQPDPAASIGGDLRERRGIAGMP